MSGYIKYFDNGGKNMSFVTDDKEVYGKYDEIWNVVKSLLKLKFAASPIRDDQYILAKLKIFKKKKISQHLIIIIILFLWKKIIIFVFLQ